MCARHHPASGASSESPAARRAGAPDRRRAIGLRGEQVAAEHLQRLGYELLARNVRTRHGEIDIVARDSAALVFVEVKTRRGRALESDLQPLAGLRARQRLRLRRLAMAWLAERRAGPAGDASGFAAIRFDAVGVSLDGRMRLLCLEHVEGAW